MAISAISSHQHQTTSLCIRPLKNTQQVVGESEGGPEIGGGGRKALLISFRDSLYSHRDAIKINARHFHRIRTL